MKSVYYFLVVFLFIHGCSSQNPLTGKWDLVVGDRITSEEVCERIVITDELFVCDGKRIDIRFKTKGDMVSISQKGVTDTHWSYKLVGRDVIILISQKEKQYKYMRVKP